MFHDVAAFLGFRVVADGSAASEAFAVGFLVFLLREHALDTVRAQAAAESLPGAGLVCRAGGRG